ncbi:hypothetical protein, partial [Arachidicoccus sp.]|uniref:hypothetical protein n=1 Tax=Arachidicoccus sp. TaxID=1872624 RepID=UPI003D1A64FD
MGELSFEKLLIIVIVIGIPVTIIVLIARAIKVAGKKSANPKSSSPISSADELEKVFQLKEKGIITPEEF